MSFLELERGGEFDRELILIEKFIFLSDFNVCRDLVSSSNFIFSFRLFWAILLHTTCSESQNTECRIQNIFSIEVNADITYVTI